MVFVLRRHCHTYTHTRRRRRTWCPFYFRSLVCSCDGWIEHTIKLTDEFGRRFHLCWGPQTRASYHFVSNCRSVFMCSLLSFARCFFSPFVRFGSFVRHSTKCSMVGRLHSAQLDFVGIPHTHTCGHKIWLVDDWINWWLRPNLCNARCGAEYIVVMRVFCRSPFKSLGISVFVSFSTVLRFC